MIKERRGAVKNKDEAQMRKLKKAIVLALRGWGGGKLQPQRFVSKCASTHSNPQVIKLQPISRRRIH